MSVYPFVYWQEQPPMNDKTLELFNAIAPWTKYRKWPSKPDPSDIARINAAIDAGADVNYMSSAGTPMMWACKFDEGYHFRMREIAPSNIDIIDANRATIVKILIDHGADINIGEPGYNWDHNGVVRTYSALSYACMSGLVNVVRVLVDHGANPNGTGSDVMSPLVTAILHREMDVVMELLDRGADVNYVNQDGMTALIKAIEYGDVETARVLIDHGADVNYSGKIGSALSAVGRMINANPFLNIGKTGEVKELLRSSGAIKKSWNPFKRKKTPLSSIPPPTASRKNRKNRKNRKTRKSRNLK